MLNKLRAEHIMALFIAGAFVLVDIVVMWVFSMSYDPEQVIIHVKKHPVPHVLSQNNDLPQSINNNFSEVHGRRVQITTLGGSTELKTEAVETLENAILSQIHKMTPLEE